MTKTLIRPLPVLVAAILAPGAAQAIDFAAGGFLRTDLAQRIARPEAHRDG
jgi:hypothetical protein